MNIEDVYARMRWTRPDIYEMKVRSAWLEEDPAFLTEALRQGRRTGRTTRAVAEAVAAVEAGRNVTFVVWRAEDIPAVRSMLLRTMLTLGHLAEDVNEVEVRSGTCFVSFTDGMRGKTRPNEHFVFDCG